MSNYSSHICKDGEKYRVMYRYKDSSGKMKNSCKRGFTLKRDAKAWIEDSLPGLIEQHEGTSSDKNLTMDRLINEYITYSRLRLRETTFENKKQIIETKILPYFSGLKVSEIKPITIMNWHNTLLQHQKSDGTRYSDTYLRSVDAQLTVILHYAMMYHNLESNPMDKAEKIGSKQAKETEYWTLEEYLSFREAIKDKPIFYYAFEVLFWAGLRIGELLALTPEDIDFEKNIMHITKSYQRIHGRDVITEPKTRQSIRSFVIPEELAAELKECIDTSYGIKSNQRIFEISKSAIRREMDNGCDKSGVKRITIHGLRHSHISLLVDEGIPLLAISPRVGHAKTTMTTLYSHIYDDKQNCIAATLNQDMEKA